MQPPQADLLTVAPMSALAGAIGALVSLQYLDDLTPRARVAAVCSGFSAAIFLTPIMSEWLHAWLGWELWRTVRGEAGLAFGIGMMGMAVVGQAITFVRIDLRAWIRSKIGGGNGH